MLLFGAVSSVYLTLLSSVTTAFKTYFDVGWAVNHLRSGQILEQHVALVNSQSKGSTVADM